VKGLFGVTDSFQIARLQVEVDHPITSRMAANTITVCIEVFARWRYNRVCLARSTLMIGIIGELLMLCSYATPFY